ncbi:MAG: hypothetical protein II670_13420, partial [Alphaproteobacteria bacterium]|nr:hypothetical protein [Alphaproteobacteria bacterium]
KFYEEISQKHSYKFSKTDLEQLLQNKQKSFFSNPNNRIFTTSKWSDRRLAIVVDVVTTGDLWNNTRHPDLGFRDDVYAQGKPFIGNTQIGNRICGKKNRWQMVQLPLGWEQILMNQYPSYDFTF